ncbi:MAG: endo-1,4-beta-xylanase [Phycisphaerae bacterium]
MADEPTTQAVEKRIREGIEKNRKDDFVLTVVDAEGKPVKNVGVKALMAEHAFGFGTCVRADRLARVDEKDTQTYRKWIPKLFNRVTIGNRMKWRAQTKPDRRACADAAVKWFEQQDLDLHGHTMIWASLKWGAMAKDVHQKIEDNTPDAAAFARKESLAHIRDIGKRYSDKVIGWDVVNEPFSERAIQEIVNPKAPRGQEPILVEWFRAAHQADPDAVLYINDYHILVGDDKEHKDSYEGTIKYLLDQKAPLGGIGMQGHYYKDELKRTPAEMLKTLDRFGKFKLPIHISEFDTFGKGWGETQAEREKNQAEFLRDILRVFFSHPQAEAFTMWGFWDGQHWFDEAPLFRKDWTPKPGLKVYRDLVFNEWWTETDGKTDGKGKFGFRGFYGTYKVQVTVDGKTTTREVKLVKGEPTARIMVSKASDDE